MNTHDEKAIAFVTAAVKEAVGDHCLVELREAHEEWTEFRQLRNQHLVAWSRLTSASIAMSSSGALAGWAIDKRRLTGAEPVLTDEQVESRARFLVRQFREDALLTIERIAVESGGSYALAHFGRGWAAINHADGALLGYMPNVSGNGRPLTVEDPRVQDCLETAWSQLERDLSRELDGEDFELLRDSLHLSVTDARLQEGDMTACSLALWSFYSTIDVAIDTSTGEVVRWNVEALSEPAGETGGDDAVAVRSARAHLRDYPGLQGPSITWRDQGDAGRQARVYWWHLEDEINVEGDYFTALVNGATGKVYSLAVKWRDVPLPSLRNAGRVSSAQALAIAEERMAGVSDRFEPANLVGMNIIQVPDADEPTPVTDRLVWRIRYVSIDGLALVEISVDCETGEIVRTTGY